MTTEQRLDSVERILGAVAATLQTVATLTERNSTAIDRLEVQIDQLEVQVANNSTAIGQLEVQVANNSAAIDRVAKSLEDSITDLVSMIGLSVEQGDRDRQLFTERAEADRAAANADRAEIRRILDYLFEQQQNGNGSQPA